MTDDVLQQRRIAMLRDDPEAQALAASQSTDVREDQNGDEEMPRVALTRRRLLIGGLFVLSAIAFLYLVLPKLAGLRDTWDRARAGEPTWLIVAGLLEVLSFGGYILLFRTVFVRGYDRINWSASYQITMASVAATRLFASAGAGGVVLTAWALRRAGMGRRLVACRMIAFLVLLYAVFMGSLVIFGIGLRTGVFNGSAPFAVTVIPAIFGAAVIIIALAMAFLPADFERRLERWASGSNERVAKIARGVATVPASFASGVRTAIKLIRERHWGVLGAVAWWGFDIGTLWASFHAFGGPGIPTFPVIVVGYFCGQLGNLLPLPGGIGGVDGGMIGAFIAFGVPGGLAVVAVLVYRGFSFWIPTIPGIIAYLQLRRTVARWKTERSVVL
ncbi:MAG TPA: lysylphosphatidylglycerol synthase transmembrane domain-containing protein [Solirubrobacteraceae bacterium]|nr:lysylphosphatidylglycerol synthase transmembrane domain-containing protein [Solirubrobacteraceae bacterium]